MEEWPWPYSLYSSDLAHVPFVPIPIRSTTLTTFMKDAINNNLQFNGTDGSKETRIVQTSPDPMGGARSPSMRIAHGPTVALQHHRQMDCGWDGLMNGWRILCYTIIVAIAASQGPLGK